MNIPNRILKIADRSGRGFDNVFNQEVNNYHTREEAFWALNGEYKKIFGEFRYKNYEAYRKTRDRRIKSVQME